MRVFRGDTRRSKLLFFEKELVRSITAKGGGGASVLGNDDDVQKHYNNHHV
jgi:hypothetical protein